MTTTYSIRRAAKPLLPDYPWMVVGARNGSVGRPYLRPDTPWFKTKSEAQEAADRLTFLSRMGVPT